MEAAKIKQKIDFDPKHTKQVIMSAKEMTHQEKILDFETKQAHESKHS